MQRNMNKPRGVVYVRRSDSGQDGSLEQQVSNALKRSKAMNVPLAVSVTQLRRAQASGLHEEGDLYLDDAQTGADKMRPGYQALLNRIQQDRSVTHLFIWGRDRLSRPDRPAEAVLIEIELRQDGITIVTHDAELGALHFDEVDMSQEFLAFVDYHLHRKKLREIARGVIRGQRDRADKGFSTGAKDIYGFIRACVPEGNPTSEPPRPVEAGWNMNHKGYVVVKLPGSKFAKTASERRKKADELKIVRRIVMEYHTDKGGISAIAKRLNEEGIPSPDAGQTRKRTVNGVKVPRKVSGKWSATTVQTILERPEYIGKMRYGYTSEGDFLRHPKNGEYQARRLKWEEHFDADGNERQHRHKKKVFYRDPSDWVLRDSPVPFDPIYPEEVYWSNMAKLRERGEGLGTRGVRRGAGKGISRNIDPNSNPLVVICGDCGERMTMSTQNDRNVLKCGTYDKKQGCNNNWVQPEIVVPYAIHAIRQTIEKGMDQKALREALEEVIGGDSGPVDDCDEEIAARMAELALIEDRIDRAVQVKIESTSEAERKAADRGLRACQKDEARLRREIKSLEARRGRNGFDVEQEVEASMEMLNELHAFMQHIPHSRLRETFHALGAELRVEFDHPTTGVRRNVPREAVLRLGVGGNFRLPRKQPVSAGDRKSKAPRRKAKKKSADDGISGPLGIGNRGDWI